MKIIRSQKKKWKLFGMIFIVSITSLYPYAYAWIYLKDTH